MIDDYLKEAFSELPAIEIYGAKAIGKTRSASQIAKSVIRLDTQEGRELAQGGDPVFALQEKPLLLDEWQRVPASWDMVKRLVDEDNTSGQYLLTGSAAPRGANIHSGAGRIVRMKMRPLSLQERALDAPVVRMKDLLENKVDHISGTTDISLPDYLREITSSGFPGIRPHATRAIALELDGYIDNIIHKEFPEQGLLLRKPDTLRNWLRAYASATASTASYQSILNAATPGDAEKPARKTTVGYKDVLDSLWITDRVDAWLPTVNTMAALGNSPKHYLVDPALSARLLRVSFEQLLQGVAHDTLGPQSGSIAGRLFESLVAQSLQVYAQINELELRHFRDAKNGWEIDFIVEGDTSALAIEVKMSTAASDDDFKRINWLKHNYQERTVIGMVINTGRNAYTRSDGNHVVPAVLLGA
ncbi:MAG: DUF4143 domain-containing protein [Coriobacteriales bacterium]|nr:DUF4143 domain-containing protein [Coriobacteriales bacterium]